MLSLPTQLPILAATILDIALDNWSIFQPNFKLLCFTKFVVAGQQILSNRAIPLTPFATAPSKFDLDRTDAGTPIIDSSLTHGGQQLQQKLAYQDLAWHQYR